MGRTKALIDVDGLPMARRVETALRSGGCSDVVLIGGDPDELAVLGLPIVGDRHPGEGPVGGLLTAMNHFTGRDVMVVACDIPYLTATAVDRVRAAFAQGSADVAVARTDRVEPMCAVWRSTALTEIQASFDNGTRSMHRILDGLLVEFVTLDGDVVRTVNRPADLPSI